ncbi:hypothetical protein FRC12_013821 [Ceratobasidium sp. 428]|nr:hypothetical protein FRC12_013821 [Ceratobasidium sp. 428]
MAHQRMSCARERLWGNPQEDGNAAANPSLYHPVPEYVSAKAPTQANVSLPYLVKHHGALRILTALRTFVKCVHPGTKNANIEPDFLVNVWSCTCLVHSPPPFKRSEGPSLDVIRAWPEKIDHFNRYCAGHVRAIFEIPERRGLYQGKLAYVEMFNNIPPRLEARVGLFTATQSVQLGKCVAAVFPLNQLRLTCHLAPHYRSFNPNPEQGLLYHSNVLQLCEMFYINSFASYFWYELIRHWGQQGGETLRVPRDAHNMREPVKGCTGTKWTTWTAKSRPLVLVLDFDPEIHLVLVRIVACFLLFDLNPRPTLVVPFINCLHLMPAGSVGDIPWNVDWSNSVAQQGANVPDANLRIIQNRIGLHKPANTTKKRKPVNYADFTEYTTYSPDASATHAHTVAMPSVSQFGSHTHTPGVKSRPGLRRGSRNRQDLQRMDVQGHYMHNACALQQCIDHAFDSQRIWLVTEITPGTSTLVQDPNENHADHSLSYYVDHPASCLPAPILMAFSIGSALGLMHHGNIAFLTRRHCCLPCFGGNSFVPIMAYFSVGSHIYISLGLSAHLSYLRASPSRSNPLCLSPRIDGLVSPSLPSLLPDLLGDAIVFTLFVAILFTGSHIYLPWDPGLYLSHLHSTLSVLYSLIWIPTMLTAMTYGKLTRDLHHENDMLDLHRLSIDSSTETYYYYFDSLIIVPAPSMHNLDYFPHQVLVLGTKSVDPAMTVHIPRAPRRSLGRQLPAAQILHLSAAQTPTRAQKNPYSGCHSTHCLNHAKIQRFRSLTNIHTTSALAPLPLHHYAASDKGRDPVPAPPASARVGPVYESSNVVPWSGMQPPNPSNFLHRRPIQSRPCRPPARVIPIHPQQL